MLVEVVVVGGGGSGGGSGGGMVMEFAYMTYMSRRRHTTTVNSSQLSINRRAVCLLYTISPEHSQLSCRRFVASSVIVRLFARCAKIKKRKGYFPPPLSTSRPHYHHYHHPPPLPLPLQIITTTPPPPMLASASRAIAPSIACPNLRLTALRIPSLPVLARCYAKYTKASMNYANEDRQSRNRDPNSPWISRQAESSRPRNKESGPIYPSRRSKPSSLTDSIIPQLSHAELQTIFSEEVWFALSDISRRSIH